MTGFRRVGQKFGCDLYDLKPDLLVAGKGMAGGYAAISECYGTEEIAQTIADSSFEVMFHTFAALPVSCVAATKVLEILRQEALIERAARVGAELKARLQESLGQHPNVAEIRGQGLLLGIEVVKNRDTLEQFPEEENITGQIIGHGMSQNVFFYPGGTGVARDIICIGAPFIIGEPEMEKIQTALEYAINKVVS